MKGDFTRKTFRKEKHYRKVNMQQGRVQLDSDWNEQRDIDLHYSSSSLQDLIGQSGAPLKNAGFKITKNTGNDYNISKGHYYVDGLLCENEEGVLASEQPNLPLDKLSKSPALPTKPGTHLVYLDVWERHITELDDNEIQEPALGGSDTTTRSKLVWQVKTKYIPEAPEIIVEPKYGSPGKNVDVHGYNFTPLKNVELRVDGTVVREDFTPDANGEFSVTFTVPEISFGVYTLTAEQVDGTHVEKQFVVGDRRLRARSAEPKSSDKPCILTPRAGYRRLSNQLYRVEIHDGGQVGTENNPTFKWSRDNGIVVAKIEKISTNEMIVLFQSKDAELGFSKGDWVEVIDDRHELWGKPGIIIRLTDVRNVEGADKVKLDFEPPQEGESLTTENFPEVFNPKVRRWDMQNEEQGPVDVTVPVGNDGYLELEDGVEVKFEGEFFETGDYWLIPARTVEPYVIWPKKEGIREALPPVGIKHHYSPLALILYHDGVIEVLSDYRKIFSPLIEPVLYYVGGDGQEGIPGDELPSQLVAGVATGIQRIKGARVRFKIEEGDGCLLDANEGVFKDFILETDETGLVRCRWKLDEKTPTQRVMAILLDRNSTEIGIPLYFNAALDLPVLYYVSGDGQEAPPGRFLPYPLMASVRIGEKHVEGAEVRFKIQTGDGWLSVSKTREVKEFVLRTDRTGSVRCRWRLGLEAPDQRVRAVLLDADGNETRQSLFFNAALDRPALYYVGGDGQEGSPERFLHFPLEAGVAIGKMQIKEAKVRFRIIEGGGSLRDSNGGELGEVDLKTNDNGLAKCFWRLGGQGHQQVEVVLLDTDGKETNLRLAFNASFAVAPQITPANTGTIKLYNPETTEFGPFDHWVANIEAPPAILLGLVDQSRDEMTEEYLRPEDVPLGQARRVLDFLNSAKTAEEIATNARVGISIARRILEERNRLGRYESLEQINEVRLVGRERFTEIVRALTEPAGDAQPCKYMEDYGLYSYGKGQPRFKVKDVDLKSFNIKLEKPAEKTVTLRWWAIPAKEQKPQEAIVSKPVALGVQHSALVLDPAACYDHYSWEVFNNIGEGLLKYRPGTTELEPGIAESYTVSSSGREYTFSLRKGLYFTDKMPLDASAVKHSIDRVRARAQGNPSWLVTRFVKSVEAVDDYTVKFVLKEPVPYFPALAATVPYFPVSPKTYPEDKITESTVGHHGPYKIKTWVEGEFLTLETNPDYYGSPPRSKLFTLKPYPGIETWVLALKSGDIDMAWRIPENILRRFLEMWPELKENYVVKKLPEPAIDQLDIPFLQEGFYTIFRRNVKGVVLDPKLTLRYYLIYLEQELQ